MADIRINALATTAASTASDDFVAVDGSANGTRKLNAYSPTFGGNLTVSGTGTFSGAINANADGTNIVFKAFGTTPQSALWTNNDGTMTWGDYATGTKSIKLNTTNGNATVGGNLTVSGTGTSSFGGNVGIGTTSPEGRLHLAASASGATGSILVLDNPIASALNNSNQIAFLNDVGASYAGIANVRLKSLTTNAGSGSSAFTITTFDGSSEAERVRVFANGNFGIGTGSTDGGQKLQVSGTALIDSGASPAFYNNINASAQSLFHIAVQRSGSSKAYIGLDSSDNLSLFASNASKIVAFSNSDLSATFAGNTTAKGTTHYFGADSSQRIELTTNNGSSQGLIEFYNRGTSAYFPARYLASSHTFEQGPIAINNTVQTAASVVSTHKVTISIGGTTYYLLATNV